MFDSGEDDDRFLIRIPELWLTHIWHKTIRGGGRHWKAYFLNTLISFSRLRSTFCFFFTHFMANIFPVFFSFTMYTSEKAPLWYNTQKDMDLLISTESRRHSFHGLLFVCSCPCGRDCEMFRFLTYKYYWMFNNHFKIRFVSLGYLKVDQFVLFRLEEASEWIAVHYMMARIYIYLVIHVNYKLRAVLY